MLIDWFTVAAQVVNFLILVALLKRFLYGPIIAAMDRREQRLGDNFAAAESKLGEARSLEEKYRGLLQELEEARGVRLRRVEEEAEEQRRHLVAAAKEEADAVRRAWGDAVRQERDQFFTELKKRVGHQMLTIARKALGDLSHAELEQLMVARFCERLGQLAPDDRQQVTSAAAQRGVQVYSSFVLPAELRERLQEGISRALGEPVSLQFREQADMPLGIELNVGGLKLSWGVDSYFEQLEQEVAALYDGQAAVSSEASS